MENHSDFQYKPLEGSRGIRLVKVLRSNVQDESSVSKSSPAQRSKKDWLGALLRRGDRRNKARLETKGADSGVMISFILSEVSLDSLTTPYIAMSYAWGDPNPTRKVHSETGHTLKISENLYRMLVGISSRKAYGYLWIDALCIDQGSIPERNRQVFLMKEIYEKAERVDVWLEKMYVRPMEEDYQMYGRPPSVRAYSSIESLNKMFLEVEGGDSLASFRLEEMISDHNQSRYIYQADGLFELFSLPWFYRVWPIQEIVMAKNVILLWDDHEISWDLLASIIHNLSKHSLEGIIVYKNDLSESGILLPQGYLNARAIDVIRQRRSLGTATPFLELLIETMQFKATDPLDKIFALLGLAHEDQDALPQVDYSLSVGPLYLETTAKLMYSTNTLLPLSSAGIGCQRKRSDIPSWVPDYSTGPGLIPLETLAWSQGFSACGNESPNDITIRGRTLEFTGAVIDTIFLTSPPVSRVDLTDDELGYNLPSWLKWCVREASYLAPYPTDEDWKRVLQSVMIPNPRIKAREPSNTATESVDWDSVVGMAESPFPIMVQASFQGFRRTRLAPFTAWAADRVFFTTHGGYFGIGPKHITEGDTVAVAAGLPTLLILRNNHELVGDAYIHGLMDGEGLTNAQKCRFSLR